jgi:hypothetical protein
MSKIMKFVIPQSLFFGACSKKVSNNKKKIRDQVTLLKTSLSTVRTFSPLGVKFGNQVYLPRTL